MAEKENRGQNQPAGDEEGAAQDNASTANQSDAGKQEPGNTSGSAPEQSGEGTGAKAGEYS
ncbi:MAG TPA: hypothetical protein VF717_00855 [Pyrinomonadaceae bacterium]|jgi:hypothetical protein